MRRQADHRQHDVGGRAARLEGDECPRPRGESLGSGPKNPLTRQPEVTHRALDEIGVTRPSANHRASTSAAVIQRLTHCSPQRSTKLQNAPHERETLLALPFTTSRVSSSSEAHRPVRDHNEARARGREEIGCPRDVRGEAKDGRRLLDVERFAGGNLAVLVDQANLTGHVLTREQKRQLAAERARANDRHAGHGTILTALTLECEDVRMCECEDGEARKYGSEEVRR